MNKATPPRSWLFVPGDSERKQTKALGCPADALILDLEDSVTPEQLPVARQQVAALLRAHPQRDSQQLWVRVNPPCSGRLIDDLNAVIPAGPNGIVLPKISAAREIAEVSRYLTDLESQEGRNYCEIRLLIIATETPQAVLSLGSWAGMLSAEQRIAGLTWGMEDLSAALAATQKEDAAGRLSFTFELARSQCLLAAAAMNVQSVDGIHANFSDTAGLKREAARARCDGFSGKLAIHPDQIAIINAAFTPSDAELDQARKIVAAFAAASGAGVTSLEGRMLDRPHLVHAQRVLAARRS